ncbi:hemagglutinin [Bacillus cereus]|uniref:hemagglutinin n=1 Tax=Bacillus cereus TaxID=1396 RepID=UPI00211E37C3|nr:hemagglutinin [Bacillus cereus]
MEVRNHQKVNQLLQKKVDKNKPEEKKEDLNKQDFEAITENAIQSKDNEVAYVLEELDKSKINFKEKSIVSNLQNGDDTTSRVLALFDKETTDKTLQDTTKDNVIAAITDNKPQVTVNGDHFAFGDQNIDSSVASIGDILPSEKKPDTTVNPPIITEGENGNTENTGTEKPKPPIEPEKPTNPEKPTEPEKPTNPEKPTGPEKPTNPGKPTEPEKPTNPEKPTEPEKPTNPEKPIEPEKTTNQEKPVLKQNEKMVASK